MALLSRRKMLLATLAGSGLLTLSALRMPVMASPSAAAAMTVARTPSCGCCGAWIEAMRAAGITIHDEMIDDLAPLKARLGVPADLQSCHTAVIDGYVIEGHVPAEDILRLLTERPNAIGLAVAGMPIGSPGMEQGGTTEPFETILFGREGQSVFARHNQG